MCQPNMVKYLVLFEANESIFCRVLLRFVIHKIAQVRAFKIKGKEPAIETASNDDDLGGEKKKKEVDDNR